MKYIVGAYATSPVLFDWDKSLANKYMSAIKSLPNVRGLEHDFWGNLHKFDDSWFLESIDKSWDFVITCIPGTMSEMKNNPKFGLASDSINGRERALNYTKKANLAMKKLNNFLGRNATISVNLHTAPDRSKKGVSSSKEALIESLSEIQTWDWEGSQLVIEHCDAYNYVDKPEKGFLTLNEEIEAINLVNKNSSDNNYGITINWGRSAIEARDTYGPIEHVKFARRHGLLKGLIFSGCSDRACSHGIWKDTHMPPPMMHKNKHFSAFSLMTKENIEQTLIASDSPTLEYIGIKIMDLPNESDISRRAGLNHDFLISLDRIFNDLYADS